MAYLSEDIANPLLLDDLPDVYRLETNNRVYGGKYTTGEYDEGISNLQAMQLMERDNYILRRIGAAAETGLYGKPGIASLDTSGKVPKTQLPTDTVYTEETQTLKNKTIDSKDNKILNTPVSISTSQTYNFTDGDKVLRLAKNVILTLGTPAVEGQQIRIIGSMASNEWAFIKYNYAGVNIALGITMNQSLLFEYSYGAWWLKDGQVIETTDACIQAATDISLGLFPNDWKKSYGAGSISFYYNVNNTNKSSLGIPTNLVTVKEIWLYATDCTAEATRIDNGSSSVKKWTISKASGTWQTAWTEITSNNGTQTLTNKTISTRDNTIVPESIFITAYYITANGHTVTPNAYRKYIGAEDTEYIILGSSIGGGNKVTVGSWVSNFYIIFKDWTGNMNCVGITSGQYINFINYSGDVWMVESGSTLYTSATAQANAPWKDPDDHSLGRYLPNSYKDFLGLGTYHIMDIGANPSDYEYPENLDGMTLTLVSKSRVEQTVIAQRRYTTTDAIWLRQCQNTWGTWQKFSSDDATATLTNKTIDANSNTLKNVVTSKNITNCITKIPQDINLTLSSDGTLTLKAGSKVYVPNGFEADGTTPKFDVVVTTQDKIASQTLINGVFGITYYTGDQQINGAYAWSNYYSGPTAPSVPGNSIWYDTTNNLCKYSNDLGVTWTPGISLPLGIITANSTIGFAELNNIFNGMGFIGSTAFVLPGVKSLAPNGRSADGSLKSVERNVTSVLTDTRSSTDTGAKLMVFGGGLGAVSPTDYSYDGNINYLVQSNGALKDWVILGTYTTTSGVISNFKPKTAFHAVDYNDWQKHIGKGTVHTVTTFENGFTGTLYWCVLNRVCYCSITSLKPASSGSDVTAYSSMPKARMYTNMQVPAWNGSLLVNANSTTIKTYSSTTNGGYGSFSYPVADDWVES